MPRHLPSAVIFDWAGTLVDYGSKAPVIAFRHLFSDFGMHISCQEARRPMGAHKKEHIRQILQDGPVLARFLQVYDRFPSSNDVEHMYRAFQSIQLNIIRERASWIHGAPDIIRSLKARGIRVGSCTGYTRDMMAPLIELAKAHDCVPDVVVTASDVAKGRPEPHLIRKACEMLGVPCDTRVIKVGDTMLDIQEGLLAGVTSVGVTDTGNEMGLEADELAESRRAEYFDTRRKTIQLKMLEAGAHGVISSVSFLDEFIAKNIEDDRA
jgi:phosphonoacetaldehyde hydrolase